MKRFMLKTKIHRATVTRTNLEYEGSLTLDAALMDEADLLPFEQVQVYNLINGERFMTYLIRGERDSGAVEVNGAAAHKAKRGDRVIIAAYAAMEDKEIDFFVPRILILDENNKIKELK